MALEIELETYKANLQMLLTHRGKFVLIHGEEIVDFFASYEDAIKDGYRRFKLEPFLVKQIQAVENIQYITRFVKPHMERKAS